MDQFNEAVEVFSSNLRRENAVSNAVANMEKK